MEEKIEQVQSEKVEGNASVSEPANEGKVNRRRGDRRPASFRKRVDSPYEDRVVKVKRITKVVKGGKRMRFSALIVTGDKKGAFGFGTGKSQEVPEAIKKASEKAKRSLIKLPLVGPNTIPHTVVGQYGATKVFLKPAMEGTGIIAGGAVRITLELAGVKNIYSKVYGSTNPINVIRATIDGISKLKTKKVTK